MEKDKERLQVIENIRKATENNKFNSKVELYDHIVTNEEREKVILKYDSRKKKLRNKFDIPEPKHRNSLTLNTKSNLNLLSLKENTIILSIKVKVSANETATFQLRKYDDLFITVKLFCEINHIKEELIKPIIIKSLQALNQIYTAMNTPLSDEDISQLKLIKSNM